MEAITEEEKNEFRHFLSVVYGDEALKWNINLRVLEVFGEIIRLSESCSRYMDLIPQPYAVGGVIKWASKQARNAVIRHLKRGGRHYLVCLRAAGLGRKTEIHIASLGL